MRTEGEVDDFEITRAWGDNAFWKFQRSGWGGGGNKIWKLSVVWYGYFLELPNVIPSIVARVAEWGFWVREKRKGHTRKEGQEHQQECYCFLHYKHPPDES